MESSHCHTHSFSHTWISETIGGEKWNPAIVTHSFSHAWISVTIGGEKWNPAIVTLTLSPTPGSLLLLEVRSGIQPLSHSLFLSHLDL